MTASMMNPRPAGVFHISSRRFLKKLLREGWCVTVGPSLDRDDGGPPPELPRRDRRPFYSLTSDHLFATRSGTLYLRAMEPVVTRRDSRTAVLLVVAVGLLMQAGSALAVIVIDSVGVMQTLWLRTALAAAILALARPRWVRLPPKEHRLRPPRSHGESDGHELLLLRSHKPGAGRDSGSHRVPGSPGSGHSRLPAAAGRGLGGGGWGGHRLCWSSPAGR